MGLAQYRFAFVGTTNTSTEIDLTNKRLVAMELPTDWGTGGWSMQMEICDVGYGTLKIGRSGNISVGNTNAAASDTYVFDFDLTGGKVRLLATSAKTDICVACRVVDILSVT